MSSFSGQFNWAEGLIWRVAIIASDAEDPNQGRGRLCTALVDTGASHTSITQAVAQQLQLVPSGKVDLQTASGLASVNVYDVKLGFIIPMKRDRDGNEEGELQVMDKLSELLNLRQVQRSITYLLVEIFFRMEF